MLNSISDDAITVAEDFPMSSKDVHNYIYLTMTLSVFDFDDTLFRIPTFADAGPEFKDCKNINEWYDHPDSLDHENRRVQLIETVAERLKEYWDRGDYVVLITRRVPSHTDRILKILEHHGLKFHEVHVIGHDIEKTSILDPIMQNLNPSRVEIFEDTMFQIMCYQDYLKDKRCESHFYFVDKTHFIYLRKLQAEVFSKIKLKFE